MTEATNPIRMVSVPVEAIRGVRRWMRNGMADQSGHTPHYEALKRDITALLDFAETAAPESVSDPFKLDLEALAKDAAERVHKNGGCVPQMAYAPILFALQDAFKAQPLSNTQELEQGPAPGWQIIESDGRYVTLRDEDTNREVVLDTDAAPVVGEPFGYAYKTIGGDWVMATCRDYGQTHGKPLYTHPDPKLAVAVKALELAVVALEVLINGLPDYLESENLTDEEQVIQKAQAALVAIKSDVAQIKGGA